MDQKIAGAITGLIFHLYYTSNLHVEYYPRDQFIHYYTEMVM